MFNFSESLFIKGCKHFNKILTHKRWVFYYCHKAGITWRGITHDLSKFSPTEFIESAKYYQGTSSPINAARKENGYSVAWQHHKGRNPHHYEYWVHKLDEGCAPIKMPFDDLKELICDYLGAGKAYNGKNFSYKDEYEWWKRRLAKHPMIHPETAKFITVIFAALAKGSEFDSELFEVAKIILNY